MASKENFAPREVVLYPAKHDGNWLNARNVAALKRGSVPAMVQAITPPSNQLDPKFPVVETVFGAEFATVHRKSDLHVLVDVRKCFYYYAFMVPLGWSSWLFGVVAFVLGIYLCNHGENLRKRDKHEGHLKYGTFQTVHGLVA
ncbi:uncharacterized protein IUM83_11039 [Phytophthora cinnamomi]|uniref:uncharacterized protein n=1 Tax=Phytophthora cinnamomi TaxID=4785 RepID=UPI00355A60BE|nr:hypothetical protein IUM83_11039 [Phytophthora cinnamomi]